MQELNLCLFGRSSYSGRTPQGLPNQVPHYRTFRALSPAMLECDAESQRLCWTFSLVSSTFLQQACANSMLSVSVNRPLTKFRKPEPVSTKLGKYVMPPEPTSPAYFSLSLPSLPGDNSVKTFLRQQRVVEGFIFYVIRDVWKQSRD
jgi:hypothetical protein